MGGYMNRILRVNLSNRTVQEEPLGEDLIRDYVGARGFWSKILYDDLAVGTDPLGERNELIFLTGPLAATSAQSSSRWIVIFKSPLTGTFFNSCGGGTFGAELKKAGLDVLVIEGASEKPVYLWIHDGRCDFRDAEHLWGLDCDDTHVLVREELKDPLARVACIGVGGENGVKYAGIFSDRRTAGRGGGGTVMGAKNLKAVVVRGKGKVEVADTDAFRAAVKKQAAGFKQHFLFDHFSTHGTQIAEGANLLGIFPTRNFRQGTLEGFQEIESSEYDKNRIGKTACYHCMIGCGNMTRMKTGKYRGSWSEGPEYETIWAFTGTIDVHDVGLTVAADKLCDDLGIDTMSAGATIGFAYELYERGIITKDDTGGLELSYGNGEPVMALLEQIGHKVGFGGLLAEGSREAARLIGKGAAEYAMHVKGLELPAYDPRGAKAQGLSYITSPVGADHNYGYATQEIFFGTLPRPVDRLEVEGKGEITKFNQDITAMMETGVMCAFPISMGMITAEVYADLISAATGVKDFKDPDYMWMVGERIFNLEKMFNVRDGIGREKDSLPRRLVDDPIPDGLSAGHRFEEEQLLADYYQVRGWDPDSGIPTGEKLEELGLSFTVTNSKKG
jgi:aldehyde:ferredoxin oxidoreductase